jgi:hypothetical protein
MTLNPLSFLLFVADILKKGFTFFYSLITHIGQSRDVVVITNRAIERHEKEALLILPGFGTKIHGTAFQKKYFSNKSYDLFIPDYIARNSLAESVENVDEFIKKQHLQEYKKVHVFGYIVGSWTINAWIKANSNHNIATIIYDRSPLQERAPFVFYNTMRLISNTFAGPIMKEFVAMPYSPLEKNDIKIGILIESKATRLIQKNKDLTLSLGAIRWDVEQFHQDYDDAFYTLLNHDELYERFDIVGSEIMHFIKNGQFSIHAKRTPFEGDPFVAEKLIVPRP